MTVCSFHIIGHRGLPQHYPENTLPSIQAALAAGAQGVKVDIQCTKDGEPVLLHDAELKRVTGLSGNVSAFELNLLSKMSAHEPERLGSQFLPTPVTPLTQLIAVMSHYPHATLFVDIKESCFEGITREKVVAKLLHVLDPIAEQCVITAHDLAVLRVVREVSDWPIGWVLRAYSPAELLLAKGLQPDFLLCSRHQLPTHKQPLWLGLWQWMIHDVTQYQDALALSERGVGWVAAWDVAALIAQVSAQTEPKG